MNWDEIIGHKDNVGLLKSMLNKDQIPHALLFTGPQGVGKMVSARIFAAGLLCGENGLKPCGKCFSCLSYKRGAHPDALQVSPDGSGASQSVKISQIRELKHFALFSPALLKGRVCVIDDAQNMTTEAANSLLKLLEEPPANFHFILVASSAQPLLPTILSRCLRLDFSALATDDLVQVLRKKTTASLPKAHAAAKLSGGRMGKALTLLQPEGFALRDLAAEYLELIAKGHLEISGGVLDSVISLNKHDLLSFLEYAGGLARDMLFCLITANQGGFLDNNSIAPDELFNPDLAEKISAYATYWDENALLAAYQNLRLTVRAILSNANTKLAIDALTIKLCSPFAKSI